MVLSSGLKQEKQEASKGLNLILKEQNEHRKKSGLNSDQYLVPAVSQVDTEDTHPMEDKLHGSQEVIQHCRLPKIRGQRPSSRQKLRLLHFL